MFSRFRYALFLSILGLAGSVYAQDTLSVRGSLIDGSSAAVHGATIQITRSDAGLVRTTQSGPDGEFSFAGLAAGDFTLVVPAQSGFAAKTMPLHLNASTAGLKLILTPEVVNQEINVGDDHALDIDPSSNRDTVAVTGDELRKLPVFDQDFVAALTPFPRCIVGLFRRRDPHRGWHRNEERQRIRLLHSRSSHQQ
jgi:hypothetical protein